MVRVISAHHFKCQDVSSTAEPCCTATAGDLLLLASPLHQVEVRDLVNTDQPHHTFPTVDRVVQMVHSNVGRYLATLESRDQETNCVRIYLNWWSAEAASQPMRARIAGRVTPASTNQEAAFLEMIELSVGEGRVTSVDVCPATGNLVTVSGASLTIFKYSLVTNNQNKSKFVDFQECFNIQLSYSPSSVTIVEDTIACLDQYQVHVFKVKIVDGGDEKQLRSLSTYSFSSESESSMDPWSEKSVVNGPSLQHPSISNITARRRTDSSCERDQSINTSSTGHSHRRAPGHLTLGADDTDTDSSGDTGLEMIPVPLVERTEREVGMIATPRILEQTLGPCATPPHISVSVDMVRSAWTQAGETLVASPITLLYAKIIEDERQHDQLKLLRMTPVYWREFRIKRDKTETGAGGQSVSGPHNPLQSLMFSHLMSLSLMFTSVHEGYLYHIPGHIRRQGKGVGILKVATYPFTCPVLDLVLEPSVLHALTETGLETYTLKSGYHTIREAETVDNRYNACPPVSTPLCLIGLRPFIGVRSLFLGISRLILLAEPQSSADPDLWTLYSLHLPSHLDLYRDMLAVADMNAAAPHGFHQLLCEAHIIVRTWLHRLTWLKVMKSPGVSVSQEDITQVTESYQQSCSKLAQHYITSRKSKEYKLALPYFRMSRLSLVDILKSVDHEGPVQAGAVKLIEELVTDPSNNENILNAEVADTVIKLLGEKSLDNLVKLVIASPALRSFKSRQSLEYIESALRKTSSEELIVSADYAVAAVLVGGVGDWLSMSPPVELSNTLLQHHHLMFDTSQQSQTFSEFALTVRDSVVTIFVEVCVSCVESQLCSLAQLLHMFLQTFMTAVSSPTAAADNAAVFQLFLENYFMELLSNSSNTELDNEQEQALLTLVRSYLTGLMMPVPGPPVLDDSMMTSGPEEMFGPRHEYLDSLPPFNNTDDDAGQETTLLKLQSLLCSPLGSGDSVKSTVLTYLQQNSTHDLALRVVCEEPSKQLMSTLARDCPTALTAYCKHFAADNHDVWILGLDAVLGLKSCKELQDARDCLLDEMARVFTPEQLEQLLPPHEEYQHCLSECRRYHQAAKLQAMIVATGHTLLDSLAL